MPRYRFHWSAIPDDTVAELATTLRLDGDPREALRQRYGARPTVRFVKDAWPTLRDGWLGRDPQLRAWVVEQLRLAGLGGSQTDDVAYLRSCRNADTLRRIVLAAFHVAGDAGYLDDPERPTPSDLDEEPRIRRMSDEFDLDAVIASAWTSFAGRLTRSLAALADDDPLIIELPCAFEPDELTGATPYIQFLGYGDGAMIRGEVSSNNYLDRKVRLAPVQEAGLVDLGWTAPDDLPTGSQNFYIDLPASETAVASALAVATARGVFDVPHPSFLKWAGATPAPVGADDAEPDDLRSLIDRTMATAFDEPVIHDDDGDIPIRSGSAMVFLRVSDRDPVVELFSPLLRGADGDAVALERLNQANRNLRFGRLTWVNGTVLANYELWCEPFVPDTLLRAVEIMMELADDLDDRLRLQLGGQRFFDDADDDELVTVAVRSSSPAQRALQTLFQLMVGGTELTPVQVARICDDDRDVVLELISTCSRDAASWSEQAENADHEEAAAIFNLEREFSERTVEVLRDALRYLVLGE